MRSILLLLVLLTGCTGWVPFFWASSGENQGFTESQWANTEANVGDLDSWEVGIGFAYGGFLPGLMEPRLPPTPLRSELDPVPKEEGYTGEVEALGRWPWYAWVSLACFGMGALTFFVWWRKRRNHKERVK